MRIRRARSAWMPALSFLALAESTARNIRDMKFENLMSRRVAICFGLITRVPVVGSIVKRWVVPSLSDMMMPLEEPGGEGPSHPCLARLA